MYQRANRRDYSTTLGIEGVIDNHDGADIGLARVRQRINQVLAEPITGRRVEHIAQRGAGRDDGQIVLEVLRDPIIVGSERLRAGGKNRILACAGAHWRI